MSSPDIQLLQAFYAESGEILEKMDSDLQNLEGNPGDAELINSLFRGLHTIKGNSSFLSLDIVTKLAHAAENMLDKARNRQIPVSENLLSLSREVLEALKSMIVSQEALDPSALVAEINGFLSGKTPQKASTAAVPREAPPASSVNIPKVVPSAFVRVDESKISKIISLVSELELLRYSLEKIPERMDPLGKIVADIRFDLDLQVSKFSRITRSLGGLVFGVRLIPVNHVFQRFPKVVKELAAKLKIGRAHV